MTTHPTLEELWETAPEPMEAFDPDAMSDYPEPAQRYLRHAIEPETPLANSVRLEMEGEIKLNKWVPFTAEQVIRWDRGLIWRARAKLGIASIKGYDRVVDGEGEMRWKLLGLIPVMTADGADITRSAAGRMEAESMWLPSVLLRKDVICQSSDHDHVDFTLHVQGDTRQIHLELGDAGNVEKCWLNRWGDPDQDGEWKDEPFGAVVEEEGTFGGFTIPTKLRVGWYWGTERYEEEGVFWRAEITKAEYR